MTEDTGRTVELATELTAAWLTNPNTRVAAEDIPTLLQQLHGALVGLSSPQPVSEEAPAQTEFTPAVSVRKSLASRDHIISMIDGKPYKTLKRHLSRHGLTPEQYRQRYNLKSDYPMVSENYSQARRDMARTIGLGRKPNAAASGDSPSSSGQPKAAKPAPGGRRKKAEPAAPAKQAQ